MSGSKSPILPTAPGRPGRRAFEQEWENELLPCIDGRELSAIEVLVEVGGDYEIAAERAGLKAGAFAMELAKCNPTSLAIGIKAINLLQVAKLAAKVGTAIEDRLDEAKPGQLIALYPRLVDLIPALTDAKINVHASQTNNFNLGSADPATIELPPEIRKAFKVLGLPIPGEDPTIIDQEP